jgi:hypothetical protein
MTERNKIIPVIEGDIDTLRSDRSLCDIRELTKSFIQKKVSNSSYAETIKEKILRELDSRLTVGEDEVSMGQLIKILETIGDQGQGDLNMILNAMKEGKEKQTSDGNIFNIFMGDKSDDKSTREAEETIRKSNPESLKFITEMLRFADSIHKEKIENAIVIEKEE